MARLTARGAELLSQGTAVQDGRKGNRLMAKVRDKQAREKLAKAQHKLEELEEFLVVVQTKGDERVRLARERADKRVAKARKRVDRQAHVVAAREARLYEVIGPRTANGDVPSLQIAADVLEEVIAEAASGN